MYHKEVDPAPYQVVGRLVLQVGYAEKFPHAFGFEGLDSFYGESASRVHASQLQRRIAVTKDV